MSLAQMQALGKGRKIKRGYVDEINARKKYLPALSKLRRDEDYANRMLGLRQRETAQTQKYYDESMDIAEEELETVKRRNKMAERLGYANVSLLFLEFELTVKGR